MRRKNRFPLSAWLLLALAAGCLAAPLLCAGRDAAFINPAQANLAPCIAFPFGTDALGRDLFAAIWQGGRVSLGIGLAAAAISTAVALAVGMLAACAPAWLDSLLTRCTALLMSVPSVLLVLFLQGMLGAATPLTLTLVIGLTGWMQLARVIRAQTRTLRKCGYVRAAQLMGARWPYLLRRHIAPQLAAPLTFCFVSAVGAAVTAESTLGFLGLGLPPETVSWGRLLAQADGAMLTGAWWIVLIPVAFLILTLACMAELSEHLRIKEELSCSHL